MKVLLRTNVPRLGSIGDIVDVKPGYARNYLLPHRLAVEPTEANLKAIEVEKQRYLEELARQRAEVEARARLLQGKEITIAVRANPEGHLYGSVGPAQICAALAAENVFIEPEDVPLDEPIHRLDKYDILLRFAKGVTATIHVWVVPVREDGEAEFPEPEAEAAEPPAPRPETPEGPADTSAEPT